MSNVQIPNLPAATGLSGSEQFEGVQSGTSVRISASQIATYISSAYPAPGIASVSGSTPIYVSTVGSAATVSLDLQGVTNAYMATMAAGTVKANVTGGSASPTDATVSQVLDTFGSTKGMMLYRDTTSWVALTSGTNGQVLTAQGTTAAPIWASLSIPSGSIQPTGVTAGTYGSASTVPQFTVLASGQLSAASNVPIVIPSTSVTGLGTMATQNANTVAITGGTMDGVVIGGVTPAAASFTTLTSTSATNLGTVQSGVWQGTPVAVLYGGTGATTASGARANLSAASSGANSDITSLSGLTTPLSAPQGGTGFGSYTTGDILYADSSSTLARLNDVATGNALISGGNGVAPLWGKIGLTTHVSGTLPVANGGSGAATLTGFLKGNGTAAFTAQATIGNADLTNSSITIGSTSIALGGTATTLGGLTTVTLTQDPTAALQAATKQYVDNEVLSVSNTTFHASSGYATTADLGTVTYSNGTSGVGATITQSGSPSVLIIDGYTFTASDVSNATRVLVKNQSSGLQNGIYTVANEGSGAANWQLIRATDFDIVGTGPNRVQTGASTFVTGGAANGATGWVMNVDGTIIIGTTALVWVQSSSSSSVTVTSPLTKVGSVISLGTVPATLGGTGLTTLTQYGVMIGNGTGNVAFASPGTSGYPLLSTGASSNPAFGQLSLTAGVTGTLPVANGGTGTATALTAGSVVFAGASGVYSQENAEFFWDNTNDFLGLGTAVPDTRLTITAPTQTSVTAGTLPAGTDLHIVGADSAITRITQDAFGTGNYPAYTGRAARGTAAAPTASQAGDVLSQYGGRGHGATAYSSTSVGRIDIEAAENFTDTAQGSYISLHTTALGSASPNERFRAGPAGQWGIGGANYGTSGQVFTSGGASAAPTWSTISISTVTGTLPVANGGTGLTSYTIGDLIYADGATSLAKLADVATGNALISGGIGVAPSYGKIGLSTHVSGTLPIGSGGTGVTGTPTNGQLLIGNGTGYSLGTLTAGSANFTVTNGSGTITLDVNSSPTLTGLTVNGDAVISTSSTNAALRITQTGTGNSLLVEDTTNPDASPFVIDTSGRVNVGSLNWYASGNITPSQQFNGTGQGASLALNAWQAGVNVAARLSFNRSDSATVGDFTDVVDNNDQLGVVSFSGSDGAAFSEAARIESAVDGTPGTNDMPGRLVFSTTADGASTPTERMRIDSVGGVGIGATAALGTTLRIGRSITGATVASSIRADGTIQADVTTIGRGVSSVTGVAASTTLGALEHFTAAQGSFGAGAAVTDQYGFYVYSSLTGATNNYGFFSNIASGTGRWNFYANGTATNYFAGDTGIGTTSITAGLTVSKTSSDGAILALHPGNTSFGTTIFAKTTAGTDPTVIALENYNGGSPVRYGIGLNSAGALTFNSGAYSNSFGTERMRIDSSGNVGIAGTSSGYKLEVFGTFASQQIVAKPNGAEGGEVALINPTGGAVGAILDVSSNDVTRYFTVANNSTHQIGQLGGTGGVVTFWTAASERMRIDSSGNVGIGISSPASLLHLGTSAPEIRFDDDDATGVVQLRQSGSAFLITVDPTGLDTSSNLQIAIDGTERFRIAALGQLGIGGANYGTAGQVLTSGGASAAPTWSTPSGGVTSVSGGVGIAVSANTGAVTISQDIYTGSTTNNATYPVGSTLLVFDEASSGSPNVNASVTVWSAPSSGGKRLGNTGMGTGSVQLTGTFRARGALGTLDSIFLVQRTA